LPGAPVSSAHRVARGGDGEGLLVEHHFLLARLVAVQAVVLLDEHGEHLALHALELQLGHGRLLRLRVDGDHGGVARRALAHVAGVAVDLHADQVRHVAHQRLRLGRHAASALGLEGLGQHVHLVGGGVEARKAQVELGLALGAGLHAAQVVDLLVGGALRVEEGVVGERAEHRKAGAQRERAFHLAVGRGCAEEVLHIDEGLQVLGLDPTFGRFAAELGRDLGAVGQELLHLHGGAADQQTLDLGRAGRRFARQVEVDGVVAGGRGVLRGVGDFRRAAGAELELLAAHAEAARVDDLGFQRQVAQRGAPVAGLDHHRDVHGVARAIDAAVAEHVGRHLVGHAGRAQAAHVEARDVQRAVGAVERQEAQVAVLAHHQHHRRLLALVAGQVGQLGGAGGVGALRRDDHAVAAPHLDQRAGHGLAVGDALHEHVARAVERFLRDDAQVGDEHQALVDLLLGVAGFAVAIARVFVVGRLFFLLRVFGLGFAVAVGLCFGASSWRRGRSPAPSAGTRRAGRPRRCAGTPRSRQFRSAPCRRECSAGSPSGSGRPGCQR
jgi:hypothetical protein